MTPRREISFAGWLEVLYGATEEGGWAGLLPALRRESGADNAIVVEHGLADPHLEVVAMAGLEDAELARYRASYARLNPWLPPPGVQRPLGALLRGEMVLGIEELRRTEFYREWGRPNNVVYTLAVNLGIDRGIMRYLSLNTGEETGPVGDSIGELVARLAPHLVRVDQILRRQEELERRLKLLETVRGPVLVVWRDGRLREPRADGEAWLIGAGGGLSVDPGGRLVAKEPKVTERLRRALVEVTAERPHRVVGLGSHRLALINWLDANRRSVSPIDLEALHHGVDLVADSYHLPAAEQRLLHALFQEGTLAGAARVLGVSRETAKTQLNSTFARTNTGRQSELLRLTCAVGWAAQHTKKRNFHPPTGG